MHGFPPEYWKPVSHLPDRQSGHVRQQLRVSWTAEENNDMKSRPDANFVITGGTAGLTTCGATSDDKDDIFGI